VSDIERSEPAPGGAPIGDSDAGGSLVPKLTEIRRLRTRRNEQGRMLMIRRAAHRKPRAKGHVLIATAVFLAIGLMSTLAFAGNPHFVTADASRDGNTLTVTFKEAGLGNEEQVHVVLSADALCINGGGKHPRAVNKESLEAEGDFPVQNGKAEGTLSVTASFDPECSPPMTVVFTNVTLVDETSGATANIPGTF
jgi:hypothetical protein